MLRTDELDYELPPSLIATRPVEPRDSARLMVVSRSGPNVEHVLVRDLPCFLRRGDLLVVNTTAVTPARLLARQEGRSRLVEGVFLRQEAAQRWRMMLNGRGRLRVGDRLELIDSREAASGVTLKLMEQIEGEWLVTVTSSESTEQVLERLGRTPLPPYIVKARGASEHVADEQDRDWYQTVYADLAQRQSVAAPTAGLHFTPALLKLLQTSGVDRAEVVLHVGTGTFRPITAAMVEGHRMHSERFHVPLETLKALHRIETARSKSDASAPRIVSVGTTTVRALESLPSDLSDLLEARETLTGSTQLLISPPYRFKHVDALLTNFHLPRSTLLALVAALIGLERLQVLYAEAVRLRYRFYSYGDAMLILP